MKRLSVLAALMILLMSALTACNTPQPLPVAPTPIPTLPPATLPAPGAEMAKAAAGVTFPASAPSQAAGETVYKANCATCHGEDGKGKVDKARDFTDVDYLRAASPVDFYQAVTGGRGTMPGFKDALSDQDRWNVVYYLWSFAVKADTLAKGKTVFEANCVACHGADGGGVIPQAPKLANVEFVSSWPATRFYQSVSAGKGIMPPWQDRLSSDERWAAVEYGRAFAYQPKK